MIISDFDTIAELSTFIAKGSSFEAEEGSHDDLVMTLVLFGWMTSQSFFAELSNTNIKQKLYEQQIKQIEEESLPTFLAGHIDVDSNNEYVEGGAVWKIVNR